MEIAGIDSTYSCAYCVCASCEHGKISPGSDNSCPNGCQMCDSMHTTTPKNDCQQKKTANT